MFLSHSQQQCIHHHLSEHPPPGTCAQLVCCSGSALHGDVTSVSRSEHGGVTVEHPERCLVPQLPSGPWLSHRLLTSPALTGHHRLRSGLEAKTPLPDRDNQDQTRLGPKISPQQGLRVLPTVRRKIQHVDGQMDSYLSHCSTRGEAV